MKGYTTDIELTSLENENFRQVLYTGKNLQLVVMSLKPGEEIGEEVHNNDQFFRVESGKAQVVIAGNEYTVSDGDAIVIPAGAPHNVKNISSINSLKMYTIYAPPHHRDGVIHTTKEKAKWDVEEFEGMTTE